MSRLRPADLRVTGEVEVRLTDSLRRNPDVVVVHARDYDRRVPRLLPEQVLLAVEIVSPGSESTDREVKPWEYARAGIPHYWRVEITREIVVHTFRLGDRGYVESGVFARGDTISPPGLLWARVEVDKLGEES